jgi:uncharacterized protein YuzE
MNITYDKEANAAYISLSTDLKSEVVKTYPCDPSEVGGMINLDFDADGRLVGIEVIDADKKLPIDVLKI